MPRPTAAQLAYGSATVVLSTLVMLLLSGVTSVVGIAVIALVALCLGLLVSVKAVRPRVAEPVRTSPANHSDAAPVVPSQSAAETRVPASLRR
ncbi:hypothetical protein GCM10011583_18990 [Streptomyces camponoticapitis]|uniref:Secreted protein n=1 Tax=Streptomyces camponoticapitis TaxID=1616125 RepID=A0ABQ2E1K4_9ACTN|nr:hypothetical protein [Streptomyces camponoticapitis]GGJ87621.1 hypothetical protein GCM10011583_18990 [Streptomyces camponoticapitis]